MNSKKYLSLRFLAWFCPDALYESIEGDLLEQFEVDVIETGSTKAKRRLFWNAVKFFRPGILFRNSLDFFTINQHIAMFKNYLIAALRNIKRHKTISFINIFGLAICLSMGLIIMLIIKTNFSYDTFHEKADRIYRITTKIDAPSYPGHYAVSPPPLAAELVSKYSFVEHAVTCISNFKYVLSGSQEIPVSTIFTNNSYFKIFDFQVLAGDVSSWLTEPYSAVLSQSAAIKIFGREDPIGKTLTIQGLGEFTVTGLLADPAEKTRFENEVYLSSSSIGPLVLQKKTDIDTDSWKFNFYSNTYIVLAPDAKRNELDHALEQVSKRFAREMSTSESTATYSFSSLQLNEIPPFEVSTLSGAPQVGMPALMIFFFSMIAMTFLLLAVFNYTNLTVARAFARSKEMGVRKITGASRSQIVSQILTESVVMACLAMIIAFIMVRFLPWSESLAQDLSIDLDAFDLSLVGYVTAFACFAGIMAGFFPALIFSRINPVQSLNRLLNTRLFRSLKARNVMIVIQFTVSVIFLALLFVMDRQANFETTADLGYHRENLLELKVHKAPGTTLKAEIEKHTSVVSASLSSGGLGYHVRATSFEDRGTGKSSRMDYIAADKNFIEIWGLALIAGNNFPEIISDSVEQFVILNETAVASYNLGSPREAIGQFVSIDSTLVQITGVVKDFHAANLKWQIMPLALRYLPNEFECLMIKFQPEQKNAAMFHVSNVWKDFEADFPIQLGVYDDEFNDHFSRPKEQLIIGTATLIAILTSCLGLLGVVLYSLETRTKEIAIRKVMGSSTIGLMAVLSKNFFVLMVIALGIGLPVGYVLDVIILQQFAYKFDLNVNLGLFVVSIVFIIGLLTICTQAIRAALANPVTALKND